MRIQNSVTDGKPAFPGTEWIFRRWIGAAVYLRITTVGGLAGSFSKRSSMIHHALSGAFLQIAPLDSR